MSKFVFSRSRFYATRSFSAILYFPIYCSINTLILAMNTEKKIF